MMSELEEWAPENEARMHLCVQLEDISAEQQERSAASDVVRTIGGITATLDKLDAIHLILDYLGPEIEQLFEEIR